MVGGVEENGGLAGLFGRIVRRAERDRVCPSCAGWGGEALWLLVDANVEVGDPPGSGSEKGTFPDRSE